MQDEPETSATSAHDEGSPRTIAASANPGAATPAQGLRQRRKSTTDAVPSPAAERRGRRSDACVRLRDRTGSSRGFPRCRPRRNSRRPTGRAETAGLTDRQALHEVLSQRQNRYLVRQLCWVLTIEGLDTYILQPRDPADLDLLVEALRPDAAPDRR